MLPVVFCVLCFVIFLIWGVSCVLRFSFCGFCVVRCAICAACCPLHCVPWCVRHVFCMLCPVCCIVCFVFCALCDVSCVLPLVSGALDLVSGLLYSEF